MQDMRAHLERLRVQAAECELIRDLATDGAKRELFAKLATHFKTLAAEIEQAIASLAASDTLLGRKTDEPFPQEKDDG
jgi:hypothetical protein